MKLFFPGARVLSTWVLIQALFLSQPLPAQAMRVQTPRQGAAAVGLEARLIASDVGLEETVILSRRINTSLDAAEIDRAVNPKHRWNMSFSGLRAILIPGLRKPKEGFPLESFPFDARTPVLLSDGDWAVFAQAGYLYAAQQLHKLKRATGRTEFTFVLARDTRSTGQDILMANAAGMRLAAERIGVKLSFRMVGQDGVLPTPMAAALVRMLEADGGVIVTASHNPPDENGAKYLTAAHEPPGAPVEAGVVLSADDMGRIVDSLKQWMGIGKKEMSPEDRNRILLGRWNSFLAQLSDQMEVEVVDPERIVEYVFQEQRQMMGLTDEADFNEFRRKAEQISVLIDANGGASSWFYAEVVRRFGFQVVEINGEKGMYKHWIEPGGQHGDKALAAAKQALVEGKGRFLVALVPDNDADRGATVLLRLKEDGEGVEAVEPAPWDVSALNLAITLGINRGRPGTPVVVLHDFPDGRLGAIARRFGARVVNVETGEVNVLTKMRQLRNENRNVVMGAEQANGGTVIAGLAPLIPGDTSRSGLSTLLLQARGLVEPQYVAELFPAGIPEPFTLAHLLDQLPGESVGPEAPVTWHVATRMGQKLTIDQVPTPAAPAFKRRMQERVAQALVDQEGIFAGDLEQAEVVHYARAESSRLIPFRNGHFSTMQPWKQYGNGGMRINIRYKDGTEIVIWMRGSLTEGGMRLGMEVRNTADASEKVALLQRTIQEMAAEITQPEDWYKTGLEEEASDGDTRLGGDDEESMGTSVTGDPEAALRAWLDRIGNPPEISVQAVSAFVRAHPELGIHQDQISLHMPGVGYDFRLPVAAHESRGRSLPEEGIFVRRSASESWVEFSSSAVEFGLEVEPLLFVPTAIEGRLPVIVVTPDGLENFSAVAQKFQPVGGTIPVDLIADNANHLDRISEIIDELKLPGFTFRFYDALGEFGNVGHAEQVLKSNHEKAGRRVQVISKSTPFTEIASFLGVPVEQSGLEELEVLAERGRLVWS